MALAYLMKDIDMKELGVSLNLTAFVIDHQARPDSGEEAEMVRGWLQSLGKT